MHIINSFKIHATKADKTARRKKKNTTIIVSNVNMTVSIINWIITQKSIKYTEDNIIYHHDLTFTEQKQRAELF